MVDAEPVPTARACGTGVLVGIAKLNPLYGVSGFPTSSFDFAKDNSRSGGSFGALMFSGAWPR